MYNGCQSLVLPFKGDYQTILERSVNCSCFIALAARSQENDTGEKKKKKDSKEEPDNVGTEDFIFLDRYQRQEHKVIRFCAPGALSANQS